jgi:hypothetical protein
MITIKVSGQIDEQHRLHAQVPPTVGPGQVDVLLLVPNAIEDDAEQQWEAGIAREWSAELSDPREDIYSLDDGEPVDDSR